MIDRKKSDFQNRKSFFYLNCKMVYKAYLKTQKPLLYYVYQGLTYQSTLNLDSIEIGDYYDTKTFDYYTLLQ